MKLTLHIGTEKTGTTTIQALLDENRAVLAERGIFVPRSVGEANHRWLPALVYPPEFEDNLTRRHGMQDPAVRAELTARYRTALEEELGAVTQPHVVMSSEHLQSRLHTPAEVTALKALLDPFFDDYEIVLYLRDPFAMAVSLYSTALKSGACQEDVRDPWTPYIRRLADYRGIVELWGGVFGPERMRLRLFERDAMVGGDLIEDLCAVLGTPAEGLTRPRNRNLSLSRFCLGLLLAANRQIRREGIPRPDRLRWRIIQALTAQSDPADPFRGSADLQGRYEAAFGASTEWVRQTYFPERARLFTPPATRPAGSPPFGTETLDEATFERLAAVMIDLARRD